MDNKITYTPTEVSEILKTNNATVRRYAEFFEIEALRDKTDKGKGHRRYTEENLQLMLKIHDLIKVQKLSWKIAKEVVEGNKILTPAGEVPKEEELNYKLLEERFNERFNEQDKVIGAMFQKMVEMDERFVKEQKLRIASEESKETLLLEFEELKQKMETQEPKMEEQEPKKKNWFLRFLDY